jgi:predicted RNA polymerase sigma factor
VPTDDDRLALIFGCCHSDLPVPAQIALTLRTVSGLTTAEIAAAFLTSESAMTRRLTRARLRVRVRGIPFEVPGPGSYRERLAAVLAVVYLVYNEGYLATAGEAAQRRELAVEGLTLARRLATLMPGEPEAAGLAALLEFTEARSATRLDAEGRLVLLAEQDRTRWDTALIASGLRRLGTAVARGRPGRYQLEAGIAAQHAIAASYEDTDWAAVRGLYDRLYALSPSPVVLLSRAVATRYTHGPAAAVAEVDALAGELAGYRLLHATRAELLEATGRRDEARRAAARALALATNPAERELLDRRLRRFDPEPADPEPPDPEPPDPPDPAGPARPPR